MVRIRCPQSAAAAASLEQLNAEGAVLAIRQGVQAVIAALVPADASPRASAAAAEASRERRESQRGSERAPARAPAVPAPPLRIFPSSFPQEEGGATSGREAPGAAAQVRRVNGALRGDSCGFRNASHARRVRCALRRATPQQPLRPRSWLHRAWRLHGRRAKQREQQRRKWCRRRLHALPRRRRRVSRLRCKPLPLLFLRRRRRRQSKQQRTRRRTRRRLLLRHSLMLAPRRFRRLHARRRAGRASPRSGCARGC
jgi:hypothetical protein